MPGKPLNYTTAIPAAKTVAECQAILAAAGADSVALHFSDGAPVGMSFILKTEGHGEQAFTLPVDTDAMQRVLSAASRAGKLRSDGGRRTSYESREHAANVAWRVVKDWLEANLALIAAQQAGLDDIMLPFLHVAGNQTLREAYRDGGRVSIDQ
jgi:hypothetical protein